MSSMVPYASIDLVYGWKAFNSGDGFTNAQGTSLSLSPPNILISWIRLTFLPLVSTNHTNTT